ncbi:glycoside hydrolase family 18 protein [Pholiota conissans]|uniref:Glycoside hydrolase family 18 protein n=1 Tax=Pholiota conissans TaxID=109636 RepID=A0A9P5ZCJ6_9AGAR|nr:glycoside hydrolase family 18 protein [Pholiota conissans]
MSSVESVSISMHTTCSTPHPHILYIIKVFRDDNTIHEVIKRYSEFVELREQLGGSFPFPPKRSVSCAIVPATWVDDGLIQERKAGLQMYLTAIIHDLALNKRREFIDFLSPAVEMDDKRPRSGHEMISNGAFASKVANEPDSSTKYIAASYYPSWSSDSFPPHTIDFSKFDVLFFAFVTPNGVAGISWDDGSQDTLKKLVSSAHGSGSATKIVLSVGGWGGSHWYSQAMSTSTNRTKLVNNLVEVVKSYGLDGIDIDWEYPNAPGAGNPHSSADAANFLEFLKSLRKELGPSRIISAAVTQLTWLGENGSPLKDVSEYAKYMTYVNVMNYDVFSSSSHPGPNAPLGDSCGTSTQPQANAVAALSQWTKAGMPVSKILLGLPLYGYVSKSTDKKLTGSSIPTSIKPRFPAGMHRRTTTKGPTKTEPARGDLSSMWGQQISFAELITAGALVKNPDGTYGAANGYTMDWDNCSDTPFIYNTERTTVVTYDDTYSIESKTKFAKKSGMAGCFTWSMDQDDGVALHDVILANLKGRV